MPYRKIILTTGEIYHIINRSLHHLPVFKNKKEASIFLEAAWYYLNPNPPVKYSIYRKSRNQHKIKFNNPLVKIFAYCLMPSHFHFILFQNLNQGIKTYIQRLVNSFSHYYNTKHNQKGSLFEGPFKAIRIETEEQLLHLSRYVHLNPVTDYLVENPEDYPFSSFLSYMGKRGVLPVELPPVLSHFSSPKKYQDFVLARKDYQRELAKIKHLLLE